MVTPEVSPQAAAAAGCTASYSVDHTGGSSGLGWSESYTYYQLSASAAAGWQFDHFEWTQVESESRVTSRDYSSYDNPCTHNKLFEGVLDWAPVYEAAGFVDSTFTITYCRAVFTEVATYGDITVTTTPDPAAGGTTTPTTETHQYAGSPSTTFTLRATANAGYRFFRWDLNGVQVGTVSPLTVTHYFATSAQTFNYVGEFLPTGQILHGSGGAILHGSGGSIIRAG